MVKWSKFFEGHKFRLPREGLNFEPSVCNKNYQIQDHVSVLFIFYWGGGGVHVEAIHIDIA